MADRAASVVATTPMTLVAMFTGEFKSIEKRMPADRHEPMSHHARSGRAHVALTTRERSADDHRLQFFLLAPYVAFDPGARSPASP